MQQLVVSQSEARLRRTIRPFFQKLKPERVQEELAAMPGWELTAGRYIGRSFRFASERAADAYTAFVSSSARDVGQPVRLQLSGCNLDVELYSPPLRNGSHGPLTMAVLDFARKLG